jgi:hypothetical protein
MYSESCFPLNGAYLEILLQKFKQRLQSSCDLRLHPWGVNAIAAHLELLAHGGGLGGARDWRGGFDAQGTSTSACTTLMQVNKLPSVQLHVRSSLMPALHNTHAIEQTCLACSFLLGSQQQYTVMNILMHMHPYSIKLASARVACAYVLLYILCCTRTDAIHVETVYSADKREQCTVLVFTFFLHGRSDTGDSPGECCR